jgi:hypothetical protein
MLETFLAVWRGERAKVHESMRKKSVACDGLEGFNWRVDVKTSSRRNMKISQPSAILEFSGGGGGADSVVRCEADREMVSSVLASLDAIKAQVGGMS